MKKILLITLVLMLSMLTVYGKKTDSPSNTNNANTLTSDNWQQVIKDVYDFDLTVPSGWTFKEGKKQSLAPSYHIQFTTEAADFKAEYEAFAQYIFDLTAKIVPDPGNFESTDYPDYDVAKKLTEIPTMMNILSPIWYFKTPKYTIQIDIMGSETTKTAQIYFVALKAAN
jgi:hypothetical protein